MAAAGVHLRQTVSSRWMTVQRRGSSGRQPRGQPKPLKRHGNLWQDNANSYFLCLPQYGGEMGASLLCRKIHSVQIMQGGFHGGTFWPQFQTQPLAQHWSMPIWPPHVSFTAGIHRLRQNEIGCLS